MSAKAAVTVLRSRQEVERLWRDPRYGAQSVEDAAATVRISDAPGDRGTEIHVELAERGLAARLGEPVRKLAYAAPLAKVKDHLRRFKALVETGEIPRSDGTPEGERAERKFKQRPAQPLSAPELQEVGA
jgi:uncharacterized membrane protein